LIVINNKTSQGGYIPGKPRNRIIAALFAFFGGTFGLHKLYLRDSGGFIFFLFMMFISFSTSIPITAFLGFLQGFKLITMSDDEFDRKYNRGYVQRDTRLEKRRSANFDKYQSEDQRRGYGPPKAIIKNNVFKSSGLAKYKDFDLEGAIEDFKKGLDIEPNDIALNFNIACAYSLTENKNLAFSHLAKAVNLGFNDFERILTHDDLAFLRIQKEFDEFKATQFKKIPSSIQVNNTTNTSGESPLVLEQLEKLTSLRDRGLLTKEEFEREHKKLVR
jgi:TM2 domain-containing membrane protein YozV